MRVTRLLTLSALALAACDRGEVPAHEASLKRFASCEDLSDYMGEVALNTLVGARYGDWMLFATDDAAESGDASGAPSDYTTTNVQEAGVDELDLVKTNGTHIFVAQDSAVQILSSWPAEDSALLASVPLDGWAYGLFLLDDELMVLESVWDDGRGGGFYGTRVSWIDVADPAAPRVRRTLDLEGYVADARLIGDDAYLVLNHYLELPGELWEVLAEAEAAGELPEVDHTLTGEAYEADREAKSEQARRALAPRVAEVMEGLDLDALLPALREDGGADARMVDCEDIYRPADVTQSGMLTVVHLDGDAVNTTGLMAGGWTVYASLDTLYVAQTSWWWWWGFGAQDISSDVHAFDLGAGGEPVYVASGNVPGWIYDQFALSEHEGHLRVATTDASWWGWTGEEGEQPANNVFVLADDGAGTLDTVGELRGIAPGEQIYAVRMMGDEGYVVTFEQVDPLFTLDLSDPAAPALVGELHIPGYSAYLHPFGEDHLLAVGRHGDWDGNLSGLAINVFDVSDPANPTLAHQHVIESDGWAWSEALWDHHAFTFHRGVLSIPAMSWGEADGEFFSGLMVFAVDVEDGVTPLGQVDHRDLVEDSECFYQSWYDEAHQDDCYRDYWYATVRRSVYVEDKLFSISNYGVKVNELESPELELARVLFYPRAD